ncbi:MAG: hypothetical protein VKJ04_00530 [Vampirovibrionales bacterium]|nr:hypothetical protein [Vampirovibrionales bacterium]
MFLGLYKIPLDGNAAESNASSYGVATQGFVRQRRPASTDSVSLQFGWGARQHREVVDQVISIAELTQAQENNSGSSFTQFMRAFQPRIDARSSLLDTQSPEPNGYSHFLNVETEGERFKVDGKLYEPADVRSPFAQATLSEMRALWDAHYPSENVDRPYDELLAYKTDAEGWSGNVLNSVSRRYWDLVDLFKDTSVRKLQAMSEAERKERISSLINCIADISHYAADLAQPLHDSTFSNHRLLTPFSETRPDGSKIRSEKFQTMHSFLEFSDAILDRIALKPPRALKRAIPKDAIPQHLMQVLRQTYPRVGEILDADEAARKLGSDGYEQRLGLALHPLVNEQLDVASRLSAELIWSAYQAGGAPDLKLLLPELAPTRKRPKLYQIA